MRYRFVTFKMPTNIWKRAGKSPHHTCGKGVLIATGRSLILYCTLLVYQLTTNVLFALFCLFFYHLLCPSAAPAPGLLSCSFCFISLVDGGIDGAAAWPRHWLEGGICLRAGRGRDPLRRLRAAVPPPHEVQLLRRHAIANTSSTST